MKFKKREWIYLILAMLCVLYSVVIWMAGSGTGFFAVWIGLGVIFILLFVLARKNVIKKLSKAARIVLFVLLMLLAAVFLVIQICILSCFGKTAKPELPYIVVLGAQIYKDGPSPVLKYRLDAAVEYLSENPETVCIVSGGQGDNEPFAEAEGMADYLMEQGISRDRILLEDQSGTTEENLKFSAVLMENSQEEFAIVTNNFHLFRALLIANEAGFTQASGIAAGSNALYLPNNMLRETFAIVKTVLFG